MSQKLGNIERDAKRKEREERLKADCDMAAWTCARAIAMALVENSGQIDTTGGISQGLLMKAAFEAGKAMALYQERNR